MLQRPAGLSSESYASPLHNNLSETVLLADGYEGILIRMERRGKEIVSDMLVGGLGRRARSTFFLFAESVVPETCVDMRPQAYDKYRYRTLKTN